MKRFFYIALMLCTAMIFAQADLQPLAIVKLNKSETITLKHLRTRVEAYQKQSGQSIATVDQRKQILEALIDEKLVVQAATKAGMNITDSQVNEFFLNQMSQQAGRQVTEKELEDIVKKQTGKTLDDLMRQQVGMGLKDYKAFLKTQLLAQQYIASIKQDDLNAVAPTDSEIRNYYEINKTSFVQSDMIKIFLVVTPKGSDPASSEKIARNMYNNLKAKKTTMDALIKEGRNKDAGYSAGTMVLGKTEQYANMLGFKYMDLLELFKRDVGFISDFNTTENDYQFYQVLKKYDAKMLAISDVVMPDSTDTVYEYIKGLLGQQKQMAAFAKASQEVAQSLNTPDNVERKKTGAALESLLNW